MSQVVESVSVLLVALFDCPDLCVLVVTHLLLTHIYGKVHYAQRHHLGGKPASSERMCMEQIKSVYSCLFMWVHLKPELNQEACILYPNAPGETQQEGPVYTAISALFMPVSNTYRIGRTLQAKCGNKKLYIPRPGVSKQAPCQPCIVLWLFCVSDDWTDSTAPGFTAKILWMLVTDYGKLETQLKVLDQREFIIKMSFLCCVVLCLCTKWKIYFYYFHRKKDSALTILNNLVITILHKAMCYYTLTTHHTLIPIN